MDSVDVLDITERNFNKISKNIKKSSYTDGITDGRDSVFQDSFDKGYSDGFSNSFILGKFKGHLIEDSNSKNDLLLKNIGKCHCQMCLNKSLINEKSLNEIIEIQRKVCTNVNEKLREKYKHFNDI